MSVSNMKTLVAAALCTLAVGACKGDTVVQPDPQTKSDLEQCLKDKADKDTALKTLQEEKAALLRNQGAGSNEILVTFENDIVKIKSNPGGGNANLPHVDDKVAAAASTQFVDLVQKSRGAIQKCYEGALKKNTGLQARTITLHVFAGFGGDGKLTHASFDPSIDPSFDQCMQNVASKWVMPQNSPAMTFKAPVSLTPS